jgi:hypothetical protein
MLLENVRTLDEAVEEVRDDKRQRLQDRDEQRRATRHERAELRALNSRGWSRDRGGRRAELPAGHHGAGEREPLPAEPVIAAAPEALRAGAATRAPRADADVVELPVRPRPAAVDIQPTSPRPTGARSAGARSTDARSTDARSAEVEPAFDLTAEDDTLSMPRLRLDSLEQKLKDLEKLYG